MPVNEFGQPVGDNLGEWTPPKFPPGEVLRGRTVELVPLDVALHGPELASALVEVEGSRWTYLPFGPFTHPAEVTEVLVAVTDRPDWLVYAVRVAEETVGFLAYLRIDPRQGAIEIGSIVFPVGLSRTTAATETLFLLIDHCFSLGYRRCEWKCDDLNAPSRAAAERLGFRYEGTFAKATHYKGRSRNTAWFAITDDEWPELREGLAAWLDPRNFTPDGDQRRSLNAIRGN